MSYLCKYSFDEAFRNSQKTIHAHPTNPPQPVQSSYLKSFKKTLGQNVKVKTQYSHHTFANEENSKQIRSNDRSRQSSKNKPQLDPLEFVMKQADTSMEEMFTSINHFDKLMENEDGESLEQQNHRLKTALSKMKNILRDKLEIALQKQKQQLSKMLSDYISLITKLLQDKQELTTQIQNITQENEKKIKELQMDYNKKLKTISDDREQIGSTKKQIQEFLGIIEQYEEEAKQEQEKVEEMQNRIAELEEEKQSLLRNRNKKGQTTEKEELQRQIRLESQSSKIQTLLELLEKNELQKNALKAEIQQLRKHQSIIEYPDHQQELRVLREDYQRQIDQLEQEHEAQFLEYERTIKDTLAKKQECIERLNLIIDNLRDKKSSQ